MLLFVLVNRGGFREKVYKLRFYCGYIENWCKENSDFYFIVNICNFFYKCMVFVLNFYKYSYIKKKLFKLIFFYFDCNISFKSNNILYCLIRFIKRFVRSSNYR